MKFGGVDVPEPTINLGLCKQVALKIASAISDLHEIREDEELSPENLIMFERMTEILNTVEAALLNTIRSECDEDVFLNEDVPMDEIEEWVDTELDFLDQEI